MRLEQLHYVIAIAKNKSITRASKKLYISQPSLSSAVNNLEKELGFKIFNRTPDGVEVTDLGEIVIEKAEMILNEIEAIQGLNCQSETDLKGTIKIAYAPCMNNIFLKTFTAFKRKHPLVNIYFEENDNLETMRKTSLGDIDLGIVGFSDSYRDLTFLNTLDGKLKYEKLIEDVFYYYVGQNHDLLKGKSEGQKYPVLTYKQNWIEEELEEAVRFDISEIMRFNDYENIKKFTLHTDAVAILPGVVSWDDIYVSSGSMIPLKIPDYDVQFQIGMIYYKGYLPAPLKEFITSLKGMVEDLIASPPVVRSIKLSEY